MIVLPPIKRNQTVQSAHVASLQVVSSLALEVREEFIWDCKLEGLLRRCLTSCKNIQLSSWSSSSSTSSVFFSSDHHQVIIIHHECLSWAWDSHSFDLVVCVPEMLETKDGEDEKGTAMIPTPRGKEVRHVYHLTRSCRCFFFGSLGFLVGALKIQRVERYVLTMM